jgi:hypothetical protein
MSKTLLAAVGGAQTSVANTTAYTTICGRAQSLETDESAKQIIWRTAGVFSNFLCRLTANTITSNSTLNLRKTGATVNSTISLTASTTGSFEDTTHTDAVVAGDRFAAQFVPGAATNTVTINAISIVFDATTNCSSKFQSGFSSTATASTTFFCPLQSGAPFFGTSEANSKYRMRKAGTLKNAAVYSRIHTRSTDTLVRSRKNGANGNLLVTITANTTGRFEDTSNSDTIGAGEDWNWGITTGSGTGDVYIDILSAEFETTTDYGQTVCGSWTPVSVTDNTARFTGVGGTMEVNATEASVQVKARQTWNFSEMVCFVTQNDISSASTVDLRVDAASSALTISVTGNTTGLFADSTHTVTVTTANAVNYRINAPSVSGTHTIQVIWIGSATYLGRVSGSYIYKYQIAGGLTRVSKDNIYKYKIVGRISLSRIYKYKIVGRISLSRIYKYAIKTRVSLSRIYKYKIVGRISLSRIYKYAIIGRVSLSRIYKYKIVGRVSLSRIYKYAIISRVSLSSIYKYRILTRVSLSSIYKYKIVGRISLSRIYKYRILTRVSLSRIYKYAIISRVSLSRIYKYQILSRVSKSNIYKYGIIGRISLSRIYKYRILTRVSLSRIYKYQLLTRVSLSRIYKYAIIGRISLSRVYKYQILTRVSLSRIYKYAIIGRVSLSRIYKYKIVGRISLARTYRYKINAETIVSASFTYLYKIVGRVSTSKTYRYKIQARVSKPLIYKYRIFTRVSLSRIYKYRILTRVSLSRIYRYAVIGRVSLSRTFRYKIVTRVSLSRIYRYKLQARVSLSRVYKYRILTRVSLPRTFLYKIRSRVSLSRIYRYAILGRVSLANIYRYKIKALLTVENADTAQIITEWLQNSWTENPYSTVEHYLIPPKSKITFGRRFDLTSGSHSDCHIYVRSIDEDPQFVSTDATIQDNEDLVNIYVEVRFIPDTPIFNSDSPAPPSRMMWHIRSFIDELIRSNPEQLSNMGVDVITHVQQIPDANTFPDVHGQSAIEQLYTIVFTVKVYYALRVGRVA